MKIYIVNTGRPWQLWLDGPELHGVDIHLSHEIQDPQDLKLPSSYPEFETVLALVHGVDRTDAADFVDAWWKLGAVKGRVWWLFYNGTGYRPVECGDAQVHFLRYDIGYEQLWSDERRRLIEFILMINGGSTPTPAETFNHLYPADNVALAAFLALLCAGRYVDIEAETGALRDEDSALRHVYAQFKLLQPPEAGEVERFAAWQDHLRQGNYEHLAQRIGEVMGQVPD